MHNTVYLYHILIHTYHPLRASLSVPGTGTVASSSIIGNFPVVLLCAVLYLYRYRYSTLHSTDPNSN
jgi:hypothetical protein